MIRFAITHINREGRRTLSYPNQARYHFDDRDLAEKVLKNYSDPTDHSRHNIALHFGNQALGTFEVREIDCHETGDAKDIYLI